MFIRRGVRTSIVVDTVDIFGFVRFVAVLQIEVHVYQGPEGRFRDGARVDPFQTPAYYDGFYGSVPYCDFFAGDGSKEILENVVVHTRDLIPGIDVESFPLDILLYCRE